MKNFEELKEILGKNGHPSFRAKQIYHAVYKEFKESFEEMSNLPVNLRDFLKENIKILSLQPVFHDKSDDGTIKTLFQLNDGKRIEAVVMPFEDGRLTVCVSTQVGCALKCKFCATGKMGFNRNLTAEEITDQVLYFDQILNKEGKRVNHVVYMGMGEPFLNFEAMEKSLFWLNDPQAFALAARNITVSTSGLVDEIAKFADIPLQINLAISLHASNQELRESIMPIAKKYNLADLINEINKYINKTHRRVSYEYVMLNCVNDDLSCAHELGKLLKGQLCHVNLIKYNVTDSGFESSGMKKIREFGRILESYKLAVTLRISRGQDIEAACGQLSAKRSF